VRGARGRMGGYVFTETREASFASLMHCES